MQPLPEQIQTAVVTGGARGLGAEICATINEELFGQLKAPAVRLGAEYAPMAYSNAIEMNQVPNAAAICAACDRTHTSVCTRIRTRGRGRASTCAALATSSA